MKHYHTCGNHRWACEDTNCTLSKHAHCGFSKSNGLAVCLKDRPLNVPESKFAYVSDGNGYSITYRGKRLVREGLTKVEQKADERHHATVAKDARGFAFTAQTLIAALEDGNGSPKLWAKIRRIDRLAKAV